MNDRIDLELRYCAYNYHPLPVVLTRGEGVFVWESTVPLRVRPLGRSREKGAERLTAPL